MENQRVGLKFNIMAIALIIVFCFAISPITLQNDTFYTISMGDQIVHHGIDMQDHFSWIKGLTYTYPHWAYDVTMYTIYHFGGQARNIYFYNCTCFYIRTGYLSYQPQVDKK